MKTGFFSPSNWLLFLLSWGKKIFLKCLTSIRSYGTKSPCLSNGVWTLNVMTIFLSQNSTKFTSMSLVMHIRRTDSNDFIHNWHRKTALRLLVSPIQHYFLLFGIWIDRISKVMIQSIQISQCHQTHTAKWPLSSHKVKSLTFNKFTLYS